ncbi:MAG: universal stress protein [Thermoanaerobaculales bacterium]|nr:universal stress protein [Thermoanaerobaculales bacterium]
MVEFAMNLNASMIIAGTRGQTPATELYLGSVSSALIHRAQCSVLIVR